MKRLKVIEMDGMEIINSFKKETSYEFSEAVPVFDDEIHFIFKVDIISIDMNPSQTKKDRLKGLIKNNEKSENSISHIDIVPIAYLLKTKIDDEYDYRIESIDEEHDSFVEKNKNKLLEEFLTNNEENK